MKNIFIVTDFSEASVNAGFYGVELAKHFKAKIFLFHAFEAPVTIPESYIFYTAEDMGKEAMNHLRNEAETINRYSLVDIQLYASEGAATKTILEEAKRVGADIIICGMKGNAKTWKKILGSTATGLIRKSTIPLIIVPEDLRFRLPNNIAFASDVETIPTHQHIEILKEFGETFDSELSIVSVVSGEWNTHFHFRENYLGFIKELKAMNPTLECLQGPDVSDSIETYVKNNHVNMIAMIPHTHSLLESVFAGSVTKKMAFLTHVPLLVLPEGTGNAQLHGKEIAGDTITTTDS